MTREEPTPPRGEMIDAPLVSVTDTDLDVVLAAERLAREAGDMGAAARLAEFGRRIATALDKLARLRRGAPAT